MGEPNLTERQQKWFASVRTGLERDTGKSLAEWIEIARTCPETGQRARAKWLKDNHGLLQNRAMWVLGQAFGTSSAWSEPDALADALWTDPAARAVLEAIDAAVADCPDLVRTVRKSFTAWSRKVQFAAARPLKTGGAMLGLALTPDASACLSETRNESWSERLKARLTLASPADVDDDEIRGLLKARGNGLEVRPLKYSSRCNDAAANEIFIPLETPPNFLYCLQRVSRVPVRKDGWSERRHPLVIQRTHGGTKAREIECRGRPRAFSGRSSAYRGLFPGTVRAFFESALDAFWRGGCVSMDDSAILYEAVIGGGKHWSYTARRGTLLRLIDIEGGANVGMLFYNPQNPLERYNAPDTLKCQHTFRLTRGHCLYSDMGRIICSIVADTAGWHDTVCGNANKAMVAERWGLKSYQEHRNDWTQNGHDAFMVEGGKYGLGRRDLAANVNWFSKVAPAPDGTLAFDPSNSPAGSSVDLRFEMDTLVLLHTCPHPMNPAVEYPRRPVGLEFRKADPVAVDDYCLNSRPENGRGFQNNEIYHLCGAGDH